MGAGVSGVMLVVRLIMTPIFIAVGLFIWAALVHVFLMMAGGANKTFETSFRALHAQRLPSYQLADFRVDSAREPALVVADILRLGIFPSAGPGSHLLVEEPQS